MGCTNSVRGWDISADRSGKNQWINTLEYRVTLMESKVLSLLDLTADIGFQGALFGDLGIAWDESEEFRKDNFIGGFGLGFRFLIPFVNMFRSDFALGKSGGGQCVTYSLTSFTGYIFSVSR